MPLPPPPEQVIPRPPLNVRQRTALSTFFLQALMCFVTIAILYFIRTYISVLLLSRAPDLPRHIPGCNRIDSRSFHFQVHPGESESRRNGTQQTHDERSTWNSTSCVVLHINRSNPASITLNCSSRKLREHIYVFHTLIVSLYLQGAALHASISCTISINSSPLGNVARICNVREQAARANGTMCPRGLVTQDDLEIGLGSHGH